MSDVRLVSFVFCVLMGFGTIAVPHPASAATAQAEWTVMIYLNSKNNLEPDGIENFYQMAPLEARKR